MMNMKQLLKNLMSEDSGQDLIEYTLIAALIALGALAAMGTVGTAINAKFNAITSTLNATA
jgi:pilus assembly protein Flp/PilA